VCAGLSCERAHIPGLNFCGSYVVWASAPIVAVIVDVEVVAGRRVLADVLDRGDNVEGLPGRYLADGLADLRCVLKPYAIDRQIGRGSGMHRERQTCETGHEEKKQRPAQGNVASALVEQRVAVPPIISEGERNSPRPSRRDSRTIQLAACSLSKPLCLYPYPHRSLQGSFL